MGKNSSSRPSLFFIIDFKQVNLNDRKCHHHSPLNGKEQLRIRLNSFGSPMKSTPCVHQDVDKVLVIVSCQVKQLLMDTLVIHSVTKVHHLHQTWVSPYLLNHGCIRWILVCWQTRKVLRQCKIFGAFERQIL